MHIMKPSSSNQGLKRLSTAHFPNFEKDNFHIKTNSFVHYDFVEFLLKKKDILYQITKDI